MPNLNGNYVMNRFRLSVFLWISIVCLSIVFLSASPLVAQETIVAIGDSIVEGSIRGSVQEHRSTIRGGWVTLLRSRLDESFPGEYEVINEGISGDTTQGVFNRLNEDVISQSPSIVIVGIGTNDAVGRGPARTTDDFRVIMEKIFSELQGGLPDASVFIMGMATPTKKYLDLSGIGWWAGGFTQEALDTQFTAYTTVLKNLAPGRYVYVDIPSQWPRDIEKAWQLLADGVHPNDAGYELMTDILYESLRSTVVHPIVSVEPRVKLATAWATIKQSR